MAQIRKIFRWLFYLIENAITPDPNDKLAKVKAGKSNGVNSIAAEIKEEGTELKEATIIDILTRANAVKLKMLSRGETVNDGLIFFEPAITGNFYENTTFDESRNACVINTRVSNDVHAMLRQVKAEYSGLTVDNGGATITGVTDSKSGELNGVITPGNNITVVGTKIRIVAEEGESVESCITYTNNATQQVTVQEHAPVIYDPSKIVMLVPSLDPGFYTLTIKTVFTTATTQLKAPRYIASKANLEVK